MHLSLPTHKSLDTYEKEKPRQKKVRDPAPDCRFQGTIRQKHEGSNLEVGVVTVAKCRAQFIHHIPGGFLIS
jgi:hypothetical protein